MMKIGGEVVVVEARQRGGLLMFFGRSWAGGRREVGKDLKNFQILVDFG